MKKLLEKWNSIHEDLEANVTRIYGRRRFHQILDVAAHSVLGFSFQGHQVTRGWVEALIAGDTKCGKSETAEKMMAYWGLSKPLNCETASLPGIVGALKEVGGKWSIQWGALPRMDGRFAVLDEVTGLTTDQISSMSGMRSSGVAQLLKVESEKAKARVRKVWLANPRTNRNRSVNTYAYGVQVIPDIIGRAEDISRFDVALVASADEVPMEVLNAEKRPKVPHKYPQEAAQALLHWVWSRKPGQVIWEMGAERAVLNVASRQSKRYSAVIPLVEPGEQRFRVARVSASLAARFHNTDRTGEQIVVAVPHVELAEVFMDGCFDSPSTAYGAFSASRHKTDSAQLDPKEIEGLLDRLSKHKDLDVALDALIIADDINRLPMLDYAKQSALLADLSRCGLLEAGEGGMFHKTRRFIEFYRTARERVLVTERSTF